jgi:hypothetical protein
MEINLKELSTQETESTSTAKKMRLSDNATSMVFQIFSKNIYSNPIGSIVREITSNCFDSHIEAGTLKTPVLIKKSSDKETGAIYISFIDYGVGMSPDRIANVYGVYFESTKRVDNTQIGGFGIGGKTPLAYKRKTGYGEAEYDNSFEIITIFDGIKYTYLIYEGKETPEYNLVNTEPTKKSNGTEVRVPVLEKDLNTFAKEMVRQLYYFENIIFEGFDDDYRYGETLMNEYQIVRGKTFLYRGNEYSNQMHVCLGRVAYPIDYNILGLNSSDYNLPVAVRLEVGEIGVTASRETIDYSESTIKTLKKKLEAVKKEITELIAKQYANIVTLEDYFMVKNDFGTLNFANGTSINVGNLIKQKDVDFSNFRYQFMKMPNDRQLFKFFFEVKSYGKKPSRSRYSAKYEFEGGYEEMKRNENLLYINDKFNRKVVKQAWLKSEYELYHIIGKRNLAESHIRSEIAELFNVALDKLADDNGKPIAYVQSLIDMQEEYFEIVRGKASDYDTIEVPEDFVQSRKNRKVLSKEMRETSIPVKFIGGYRSKERVKLDLLFNYNSIIFYGTQENESDLKKAYDMYCALFDSKAPVNNFSSYDGQLNNGYNRGDKKIKKTIMFILLASNNTKYMEYCKKAYTVDQFFLKILYRKEKNVMTYFQTYDLKVEWDNVEGLYKEKEFAKVSDKWAKKVKAISDFINKLPESSSNFGYMKTELSKYFDLSNIKPTGEQKVIAKAIAEVKNLQKNNQSILEFIDMPYDIEKAKDLFFEILKKVMAL